MSASYPPVDTGVSAGRPSPAKLLLYTTRAAGRAGVDVVPRGGPTALSKVCSKKH